VPSESREVGATPNYPTVIRIPVKYAVKTRTYHHYHSYNYKSVEIEGEKE
jgi:hypothetical protein